MEPINKPQFDEVDLNRLYEALEKQIEAYNCARAGGPHPMWKDEIAALVELRDRIGRMLDGEDEDPGCGSDCCGASCICHAR